MPGVESGSAMGPGPHHRTPYIVCRQLIVLYPEPLATLKQKSFPNPVNKARILSEARETTRYLYRTLNPKPKQTLNPKP